MPDYSKHLQDIAAALSRPSTPAWIVPIISCILGFASAVFLQLFQRWLVERSKRNGMRRLLYVDLAEVFLRVEQIMEFRQMAEPERWSWQKEQLKLHIGFEGEKNLRANQDTYVQLPERPTADSVYAYFHKALDDIEHWWNMNWCVARQVFAQAVCEDVLRRKHFRKFVGKRRTESLCSRCKAIHEESQEKLKEKWHDQKP